MDDAQRLQALSEGMASAGYSTQAFTAFETLKALRFKNGNAIESANAGDVIQANFSVDVQPRLILGFRVVNVWSLPDDPTAQEVELAKFVKEHVDDEQSFKLDMTRANFTLQNGTPQKALQGGGGSNVVWHYLPVPYPSAGAQDFSITLTRLSSYPKFRGVQIQPQVHICMVSQLLRSDWTSEILRRGA
jgi:hypothetical protein